MTPESISPQTLVLWLQPTRCAGAPTPLDDVGDFHCSQCGWDVALGIVKAAIGDMTAIEVLANEHERHSRGVR